MSVGDTPEMLRRFFNAAMEPGTVTHAIITMDSPDHPEHYHCPFGHEHPQPLLDETTGKRYCRACLYKDGVETICEPCVPGENC